MIQSIEFVKNNLYTAFEEIESYRKKGYYLKSIVSNNMFGDDELLVECYEIKMFKFVSEGEKD